MPALVSDWHGQFSEPIRLKQRRFADLYNRNATWYGIETSPYIKGWYQPFSEPVRSKPPLTAYRIPYLALGWYYLQYTFALTEIGDSGTFSMLYSSQRNRARVTITEIETYPTRVTIKERNYSRGYS